MRIIKNNLIAAMETIGYYYDDIDSYEDWIVFNNSEYCTRLEFSSWKEVYEWLDGVILDSAAEMELVGKMLHPEKYEEA